MSELETAETRVVIESPVHGPVLLEELGKLRGELADVKAKWAVDDHEARLLRFALYEIDSATKRGGVDQVLTAIEDALRAARLIAGHSTPAVTNLLNAATAGDAALYALKVPMRQWTTLEYGAARDFIRDVTAAMEPFKEVA